MSRAAYVGRAKGMTLVELLVAMAIALVLTLAVTSVISIGQAHRRTTTSTNDMEQTGAYAAYLLDRVVRSAGSGFTQSWKDQGVYGCKLIASRGGTAILPRGSTFPVPFAGFLGNAAGAANLRMTPVLIHSGASAGGSDVLMVMGGNAPAGDVPRPVRSFDTGTTSLRLDNTIGLKPGDIGLVSQNGATDCLIEQVSSTFADGAGVQLLPLSGTYYTAGASNQLQTLASSTSAFFTPLGNAGVSNLQFQLYGVGDNNTLFRYDLLRQNGTDSPEAVADGVVAMRALYGLDTDTNGAIDTWVDPAATGYDPATMMTAPTKQRQVVAIRIALLMRTSLLEKPNADGNKVSPGSYVLFSDIDALKKTINLSADEQNYRYRVVDFTVPVRNTLILPTS